MTPESLESRLQTLEKMLGEQGRSLSEISVSISPAQGYATTENLRKFEQLGVEQVLLPLFASNTTKLREKATKVLGIATVIFLHCPFPFPIPEPSQYTSQ